MRIDENECILISDDEYNDRYHALFDKCIDMFLVQDLSDIFTDDLYDEIINAINIYYCDAVHAQLAEELSEEGLYY